MVKKNYFFAIALLMFMLSVSAQDRTFEVTSTDGLTELKVVGNFTITDSDGYNWTLYDELDKGNTIFIDIFQAT